VRLALHAVLLGLGVAARLLGRIADVTRDLVQAARVLGLRALDPGRLLEDGLGVVAGLLQRLMRLARITLDLGLRVATGFLGRVADVVGDLVEAAGLVIIGRLRAHAHGAAQRKRSGEGRDAYLMSHWSTLQG
jgi:phosphate uptake regulator